MYFTTHPSMPAARCYISRTRIETTPPGHISGTMRDDILYWSGHPAHAEAARKVAQLLGAVCACREEAISCQQ